MVSSFADARRPHLLTWLKVATFKRIGATSALCKMASNTAAEAGPNERLTIAQLPPCYLAGLRLTSRATKGTVPLQGKLVMNRSVPCLSLNAIPDCSEPPTYSPHSCGMLATQAPKTSCGAALARFVGKNNSFAPTRTKTTSSTFTILFFIERLSYRRDDQRTLLFDEPVTLGVTYFAFDGMSFASTSAW